MTKRVVLFKVNNSLCHNKNKKGKGDDVMYTIKTQIGNTSDFRNCKTVSDYGKFFIEKCNLPNGVGEVYIKDDNNSGNSYFDRFDGFRFDSFVDKYSTDMRVVIDVKVEKAKFILFVE